MKYHCIVWDKTKPRPKWLCPGGAKTVKTQEAARYFNIIYRAQPVWANIAAIRAVYKEAARRRQSGEDVQVDHIYPLNHPRVCGLHVHTNLRVITRQENMRRANHDYPGHPQRDLFEETHASLDFELEMQYNI